MLTNPNKIEDKSKYKCKDIVMKHLTFKCHIPLLGFDGEYYYFANNEQLNKCLREMPFWLKLFK